MLSEGTLLGDRYRVGALVGRGGMADVYRGEDQATGTTVAVKVLRHVATEDARRFAAESRTLARLDHPAVVRFCDSGDENGTPFLVTEYIEGPSLADLLRSGPLGFERAVALGAHLADALNYAHGLGVVHRDVKPGNVLIDREGVPRLADFGIARLTDATSVTASGVVVGTASYVAPEQLEGGRVGPPADVYSLGLVLLECTTGRRAYEGTPAEAAMARLVRDPDIPPDLPVWWSDLLRRMTSLGPDFRPSTDEVRTELRRAGGVTGDETVELRTSNTTLRLPAAAAVGNVVETAVIDRPAPNPTPVRDNTAELEPAAEPEPAAELEPAAVPRPVRRQRRRLEPTVVVLAIAALVAAILLVGLAARGGDDSEPLPPELERSIEQLEEAIQE